MKSQVTLLAFALALSTAASAADSKLELRTTDGVDYVSYDPTRVQRPDLIRWMQLSPNVADGNHYEVPESLELCVDNEPDYLPCGSRDLRDPNFFRNAEINIKKIQQRIRALDQGSYPPELQPILHYFHEIQTAFLSAEEKRLTYLKSWNPSDLSGPVGNIDVGKVCSTPLKDVTNAPEYKTAYQLASKEWGNCVNEAVRKEVGPYPKTAWEEFLRHYSLHERFVSRQED